MNDESEVGPDLTTCAEHRDGKPGEPHEWRRGRRGKTRIVTCTPSAVSDRDAGNTQPEGEAR